MFCGLREEERTKIRKKKKEKIGKKKKKNGKKNSLRPKVGWSE